MNKSEILKLINDELSLQGNKSLITQEQLDIVIIDVSRVLDSKITELVNEFKKINSLKINSYLKEQIRSYLLGYPIDFRLDKLPLLSITDEDKNRAYELVETGFLKKQDVMIKSIIARYDSKFLNNSIGTSEYYLNYLNKIEAQKQQLIILNINGSECLSSNNICEIIEKEYSNLSNYHNFIIVFNDDDKIISWETISEVAIFMENFKKEYKFNVFNKNKNNRINELLEFLSQNERIEKNNFFNIVNEFYDSISYGFHFSDLFISENGKRKILVMQKIELDEEEKACPSCLKKEVRGNSYSRVLYKSFECSNQSCPSRSKAGRGKRFDLYSVKRSLMMTLGHNDNLIDDEISNFYRRDIIEDSNYNYESLIYLYSWKNDNVLILSNQNLPDKKIKGRFLSYQNYLKNFDDKNRIDTLPIVILFKEIYKNIANKEQSVNFEQKYFKKSLIINGNSTVDLKTINRDLGNLKIGGAITSPPYYNVREYSQWKNIICYFIDMMINASNIYHLLSNDGTYIYNIGDIVDQDNIYINSFMSKRRQMLGFYSIMIFKIVGFYTTGNIIWDKGEVESKRNSTSNRFPGYLKPINAYEHNIIFQKKQNILPTKVKRIDTVKKINSKGINTIGHTAPYPIEIAELIIPFLKNKDEFVLDPFLGSGTTLIAMIKNNLKGIGFELNNDYYNLAFERISNEFNKE